MLIRILMTVLMLTGVIPVRVCACPAEAHADHQPAIAATFDTSGYCCSHSDDNGPASCIDSEECHCSAVKPLAAVVEPATVLDADEHGTTFDSSFIPWLPLFADCRHIIARNHFPHRPADPLPLYLALRTLRI